MIARTRISIDRSTIQSLESFFGSRCDIDWGLGCSIKHKIACALEQWRMEIWSVTPSGRSVPVSRPLRKRTNAPTPSLTLLPTEEPFYYYNYLSIMRHLKFRSLISNVKESLSKRFVVEVGGKDDLVLDPKRSWTTSWGGSFLFLFWRPALGVRALPAHQHTPAEADFTWFCVFDLIWFDFVSCVFLRHAWGYLEEKIGDSTPDSLLVCHL